MVEENLAVTGRMEQFSRSFFMVVMCAMFGILISSSLQECFIEYHGIDIGLGGRMVIVLLLCLFGMVAEVLHQENIDVVSLLVFPVLLLMFLLVAYILMNFSNLSSGDMAGVFIAFLMVWAVFKVLGIIK